MNPHNREQKGS